MSEKTNYNTQKISCQDATLVFGGISKDKANKSSFEIRAGDGRHIFRKDRRGPRKGWTTSISPGNFQLKAGLDNKEGTTIYVEAENGDVVIKSMKGNIRFEAAENIELYARKNIMMEANAQMDLNAQNINVEARCIMNLKASSFLTINAPCGMEILSGIIRGVSCASGRSASFLDS